MAAQVPDPPTDLESTASSDISITIEWLDPVFDGGDPVNDFKIYWNAGDDNGNFVLLQDTNFGSNTFTKQDSDIVAGNYYEFKVVAVNSVGDSSPSLKIRVIAASVPSPPINLSLLSQSKTQVTFTWSAGANGGSIIRDYEIFGDEGSASLPIDDFI